jgi:hypothetical protein
MSEKFQRALAEKAATAVPEIARQAPRPEPREEDPRARAAARAAQIRGDNGGMDEGADEFYIPKGIVPDGWTYEWKRHTIWNQEDPAYAVQLAREGWEVVPASRHPQMMPSTWERNTIERKGMLLMERPSEISEEVRRIDLRRAREQVRIKEAQIAGAPDGTFTRDDPRVRPNIKKTFDMPIPEDL